jgi:predicted permease
VLASIAVLIDVVLPVFTVVALGALAGRWLRIDVPPLNRTSLYVLLPFLAFRAMAGLDPGEIAVARLVLGFATFAATIAAIAWTLGARLDGPARRAFAGTSMLGNGANVNLSVALFAFGEAGLDRAVVLYVATALLMYTLGPVLFGQVLRTVAGFPVLWAALAGLVVNRTGVALPLPATRVVELVADAAIPVMLLILGLQLVKTGRWRPTKRVWGAVTLKMILAPALGTAAGVLVGLTGLDLAALVLLSAMPTAVNTLVMTVEFGGDPAPVGETVAITTAASLVTLPIVLTLLRPLL